MSLTKQEQLAYFVTGSILLVSVYFFSRAFLVKKKSLLSPKNKTKKQKVKLVKKETISPDTMRFTFEFNGDQVLGIDNGQHVKLYLKVGDETISRNYTPTSPVTQKGSFQIVAKIYRPCVHPDFPNGGKFTPHLEKVNIGDQIEISGPVGRCHYRGNGCIDLDDGTGNLNKSKYKNIIMIAGGTGITPMYQLIDCIYCNSEDCTGISLVYINRNEEDILLRKELEDFQKNKKLDLTLGLTKPNEKWQGYKGRLSKEFLEKLFQRFKGKEDETIVTFCGPFGFNESSKKLCKELGFTNFYTF